MTAGVYHKHMTQRVSADPHWRVNCTAYCAAMLINDSVLGGLEGISGRLVRALSDEANPDPSSPGLNLQQIDNVCRKLRVPFYVKTGESWTKLRNYVGSGSSRAILQLDYKSLGDYRAQANGDFGHAFSLQSFDVSSHTINASDPLAAGTRIYPESVVRHAAEVFAQQTGLHGIWFGISRTVPRQCG